MKGSRAMSAIETRLRAQARRLQRLTSVACAATVFLVLMESLGPIAVNASAGALLAQTLHALAHASIAILPALFYLYGLWQVRCALAALAEGGLFAAAAAVALDRVGWALAIGGLVGVALVPTLSRLAGADPGYVLALDVGAVVLAMIGLALVLFADLFRRAEKLQNAMREII
jgi:hypothetical protein